MKLKDILIEVYGLKKDGNLKSNAIKFCEKYNLNLDGENNVSDIIIALSHLSNKDKKEKAIRMVLESINTEVNEDKDIDLLQLRKLTYKQSCRLFHPDNKETGNNGVFQFIQDIKYAFWDYKGNPRKDVKEFDWIKEKEINEDPFWVLRGRR